MCGSLSRSWAPAYVTADVGAANTSADHVMTPGRVSRVNPTCLACDHRHLGDEWGGICVGCPCEAPTESSGVRRAPRWAVGLVWVVAVTVCLCAWAALALAVITYLE